MTPSSLALLAGLERWIEDAIGGGSYLVLALVILAENLIPPIPSEAVLPLAGFLVDGGTLAFVPAVLAATSGSVLGALLLYALGRFGGRPLLERHGRVLRLDRAKLDRADAWFDRHGPWLVLFGRLVPGVRSVISIPAGLSEMPVATFVALTALGSLAWNSALIGAGWALGARWEEVTATVAALDAWLLGGTALLVAGAVLVAVRRRRRRRARA